MPRTRSTRERPWPLSPGDITKKAVANFTGKDECAPPEQPRSRQCAQPPLKPTVLDSNRWRRAVCCRYEFGDVTKKLGQMLFGNKEVQKKDGK